jgi:hypothetical protein
MSAHGPRYEKRPRPPDVVGYGALMAAESVAALVLPHAAIFRFCFRTQPKRLTLASIIDSGSAGVGGREAESAPAYKGSIFMASIARFDPNSSSFDPEVKTAGMTNGN